MKGLLVEIDILFTVYKRYLRGCQYKRWMTHVKSYADLGVCTVLIPFVTGMGVILLYTLTGLAI
ncbi:MAG: hypothetical protein ABFD45_07290 [Smithella sp.]